jgi:hypothetical protein
LPWAVYELVSNVEFLFITPHSLDKKADYQADAVGLNGLQTLSDVIGEKGGDDWKDKIQEIDG